MVLCPLVSRAWWSPGQRRSWSRSWRRRRRRRQSTWRRKCRLFRPAACLWMSCRWATARIHTPVQSDADYCSFMRNTSLLDVFMFICFFFIRCGYPNQFPQNSSCHPSSCYYHIIVINDQVFPNRGLEQEAPNPHRLGDLPASLLSDL